MCFPPTLMHLSGLALANGKFDDEVAAHSDPHHDHSRDYEDHEELLQQVLATFAATVEGVNTCAFPISGGTFGHAHSDANLR